MPSPTLRDLDSGESPSWLKAFALAFLNGVNPMTGIGQGMSAHTDQMYPAPVPAVAPTPYHWWHQDEGHPLYPMGPPADFGGSIIPNPDNLRVLSDLDTPSDQLTAGQFSTENFRGKTPVKKVSRRPAVRIEEQ